MDNATKFAAVFDGLKAAYGTYRIDRKAQNGKNVGKATVLKSPRTDAIWEAHLSGQGDAIGIIPINEDSNCKWGCIDVDTYPLDHGKLVAHGGLPLQERRRPLLPFYHGVDQRRTNARYPAAHCCCPGLWRQ